MGMKDSGIEWIGEIPDNWKICKIKNQYKLITGFTPETSRDDFYDDNGETWISIADMTNSGKQVLNSSTGISAKYIQSKHPEKVKEGSLLYSFKLSVGKVGFAQKDLYTNEAIASFQKNDEVCLQFLYYASFLIEENANINIYGAKILNQDLINNSITIVPPLQEQQLIASFLDDKVGKIDDILSNLNKQVEILENYKKSLITEAVTKGLDPDVEMKDSGIDWISEIPKEWKMTKLKYHSIRIGDGLHGTPDYDLNGEYLFINGGNFKGEYIIIIGNEGTINAQEFKKLYSCDLNENSVLIALNGVNYGEVSYYHNEKILLGKSAGYITLNNDYLRKYVGYYLQSDSARTIMVLSLNNTTIPNLSLNTLNNFNIPLPSIDEQQEIVSYLDKQCAKIDSIIADKKQQLETLEQYKKSLIYEYATGKKRVKGVE